MEQSVIKLCEALFDIAFEAGYMSAKGFLSLNDVDSRDVFQSVLRLAQEFEAGFSEGNDYLTEVLKFSHTRLPEMYGKNSVKG